MITNFQLVAICRSEPFARIVPLTRDLQQTMQSEWSRQMEAFCDQVEEITFDPGYKPERNERFVIEDFSLPAHFPLSRESLNTLDQFDASENAIRDLDVLLAYGQANTHEIILMQRFTRSHVIRPGRIFFLVEGGTFETAPSSALSLGTKLDAVYYPDQQRLVFANFRNANSILPLAEFYEEASEAEIREILRHPRLSVEDSDALAVDAPQWFRTRFSMLRDSGVLDNYTPTDIRNNASGYLEIQTTGTGDQAQIVFPTERSEAKRLLQFLNEELYKGAITETLYETNSKREAD